MSDEFDPVEAIREAAHLLETFGPETAFAHNRDEKVAAMLRGADQLEAALNVGDRLSEMVAGYKPLTLAWRQDGVGGAEPVFKLPDGTEYNGPLYAVGAGE